MNPQKNEETYSKQERQRHSHEPQKKNAETYSKQDEHEPPEIEETYSKQER